MATIVVFASLLIAPQLGRALVITNDPILTAEQSNANVLQNSVSWMDVVKNTISSIADVSTEINTYALWVKTYVLDPLAFVLSGNALKAITAGIIDFVNGGNGRGPLFVRDLRAHALNTGDVQAFAFFAEFGGNSNSPFSANILSSLRANYLLGTSAAGFWAANRSTLPMYSQNPMAFVGGNFSQGGWSSWFALTTQPQNNPYMQYYRAQAELYGRVAGATSEALTELAWGGGFMSWCGEQTSTGGGGCDPSDPTCIPDTVAITSQNNCTTSDGSPGTIQTPGSVIQDGLQKALGTDTDRLINVGDANTIFRNIASTLQIMSYGAGLLGAGNSGGLFGVSQPSGATPTSMLERYRNQQGYMGLTQAGVNSAQTAGPQAYSNPSLLANAASAETIATAGLVRPTDGNKSRIVEPPPPPTPPPTMPPSPDGTIISGGAGSLQTVDGRWTFGPPYGGAAGKVWYIFLNGQRVGEVTGSKLMVNDGGQISALGTDNNWWIWKDGSWSISSAPPPCDTSSPNNQLYACLFDEVGAQLTASRALHQYTQISIPTPVGAWNGFFENWGSSHIANTGRSDRVSGVWRGTVTFLAGTYIFHTQSDDGVELVIDGNIVIDNWDGHALLTDNSDPVALTAGPHTVQLRWYESGGEAAIGLSWSYTP